MRLQVSAISRIQHLVKDFSFADVSGAFFIGSVPANSVVELTVIDVQSGFNGSVSIEVGRIGAPAELMLGTDNNPHVVNRYQVANDMLYSSTTDLYLTFIVTGTPPTTGFGRITVYLN